MRGLRTRVSVHPGGEGGRLHYARGETACVAVVGGMVCSQRLPGQSAVLKL